MKDSPSLLQIAELLTNAQHVVVLAKLHGKLFVISNKKGHLEDLVLCADAQKQIEIELKKSEN